MRKFLSGWLKILLLFIGSTLFVAINFAYPQMHFNFDWQHFFIYVFIFAQKVFPITAVFSIFVALLIWDRIFISRRLIFFMLVLSGVLCMTLGFALRTVDMSVLPERELILPQAGVIVTDGDRLFYTNSYRNGDADNVITVELAQEAAPRLHFAKNAHFDAAQGTVSVVALDGETVTFKVLPQVLPPEPIMMPILNSKMPAPWELIDFESRQNRFDALWLAAGVVVLTAGLAGFLRRPGWALMSVFYACSGPFVVILIDMLLDSKLATTLQGNFFTLVRFPWPNNIVYTKAITEAVLGLILGLSTALIPRRGLW